MKRNYAIYVVLLILSIIGLWGIIESKSSDQVWSMEESSLDRQNNSLVHYSSIRSQESQSIKKNDFSLRFFMMNACRYIIDTPKDAKPNKTEESKQAFIDIIADLSPDCIGLCEVGHEPAVKDIQKRLKVKGHDYPYTVIVRGVDKYIGLAFLSKIPISKDQSQGKVSLEGSDKMLRGILDVEVTKNGHPPCRFIGVHLKSKRNTDEGGHELRMKEAHALRHHLDQINDFSRIIVYGDFNDYAHSGACRAILGDTGQKTLKKLKSCDSRSETWTYYYPAEDIYSSIDHIFLSPKLMPLIKAKKLNGTIIDDFRSSEASDHRGILLEIRS